MDVITELVTTSVALAVMNVAEQKNKLVLISGAASADTNERCNANTVHWVYDSYRLAAGTAKAVVQSGKKNWYFIAADYAAGAAMTKEASQVVTNSGGKVLGVVKHPFPASHFSSFLVAAQSSKADVIALANGGQDTITAVKQAAEFGITGSAQTIVPIVLFITDVHALGLKTAQGLTLTEGFYRNRDEKTRAWSRRFFEKARKMPSMAHAGVYSSVLNYLKAVEVGGLRGALYAPLLDMEEGRWQQTMDLNFGATLLLVKRLAPGMLERGYGRIVNFSSIAYAGERGQSDYAAAKAAVAALTRSLAMELAPSINVNCVAPGLIDTSVVSRLDAQLIEGFKNGCALKRLGKPEEIAQAVLFLASEEASYITGEILHVAGGRWPALQARGRKFGHAASARHPGQRRLAVGGVTFWIKQMTHTRAFTPAWKTDRTGPSQPRVRRIGMEPFMPMLLDRIRRKTDRRIKHDHGFLQCKHVAQPPGDDEQQLCLRDDAGDAKEAGQAQRDVPFYPVLRKRALTGQYRTINRPINSILFSQHYYASMSLPASYDFMKLRNLESAFIVYVRPKMNGIVHVGFCDAGLTETGGKHCLELESSLRGIPLAQVQQRVSDGTKMPASRFRQPTRRDDVVGHHPSCCHQPPRRIIATSLARSTNLCLR